MSQLPSCPICTMTDILDSADTHECVTCGHEWARELGDLESEARIVKDANGNVLADGDSVTLVKDLKLKGTTIAIKAGTKIKKIRIVDGDHEVDCRVNGMSVMLKAIFLKKA